MDWGLGHATRCIAIINELLLTDYEIIIASEGSQMNLLKNEFPHLKYLELKGYRLKYGKSGFFTVLRIILQIPKILIQINLEKAWIDQIISSENIDVVISDNRYGLHSKKIISIFLTHQLYIKTPFGKLFEKKLMQLNYKYINQFSCCWVPDFEKENILAGELSHPKNIPKTPIKYIGILSRFKKKETIQVYKLLILLSGPEPQRTILENLFLLQLKVFKEKTVLIRGLPDEKKIIQLPSNVEIHNHLSASALNEKILQSELVICRSGFSTIMDLARLGKPSVVIPTPGQSEQEYLADYLSQKRLAIKKNQNSFILSEAFEEAKNFSFEKYEEQNNSLLTNAVRELF